MNLLDLVAKITLDKSDYEQGLAGLKADIDSKQKSIEKGMLRIVAVGTAAVGAFIATAVKTGATFNKAMSQVAATMGLTMEELRDQVGEVDTAYGHFSGNLEEYAKFMGENTAFSASQAAEALNYMALAGYEVQESMIMLPNVLNLAAAGNMDLATASDMVTDAQTAFGLTLEEMPQLIDEMAKAASTGNTSVQQLGDAFLVIGGLAQELNGGFITLEDGTRVAVSGLQELEIALTAMANAGIKGSEAGTHMRNMIMKLASPTSEGTKKLEEMGVSVFDAEGNMRSLADIMGDLSGKLGEMTQEEKIQAISELFNARDLASAEALLQAIGADWDKIGASIIDSDHAAQQMADTQLDNLAGDITLMKSAFEGLQISISDKVTPALRGLVKFATKVIQNFDKIIPVLAGVGTAFATFAIAINITSIIRKVTVAVTAFFNVLSANPVALIIAAIAGLIAAFVALYKNNEKFRNKVNEIWESIKTIVLTAVDTIKEYFNKFIAIVTPIWNKLKETITAVWDGIVESVQPLIDSVVGAFEAGWEMIQTIWNLPEVQAAWEAIKEWALAAWEGIKVAWDIAKDYFSMLWENIKISASTAWSIISGVATVAWSVIKTVWNAVIGFFTNIFNTITGIFSAISSVLQGDFEGAYEAIQGVVGGWIEYFQGIWDDIVAVFNNARSVGTKIVNDILNGIIAKWSALTTWVSNAWDRIKKLFTVEVTMPDENSGGGDSGSGVPGKAIGMDFVPQNKMPAILHRGEAVLTAREADTWRRGGYERRANDPNVEIIVELLQDIVNNGLNANIAKSSIYRMVNDENRKRSRATNYNSLAMA